MKKIKTYNIDKANKHKVSSKVYQLHFVVCFLLKIKSENNTGYSEMDVEFMEVAEHSYHYITYYCGKSDYRKRTTSGF